MHSDKLIRRIDNTLKIMEPFREAVRIRSDLLKLFKPYDFYLKTHRPVIKQIIAIADSLVDEEMAKLGDLFV